MALPFKNTGPDLTRPPLGGINQGQKEALSCRIPFPIAPVRKKLPEEMLAGGSQNQVAKAGSTVHRRIQGHPALHKYLLYLEKEGMEGVPRFLGIDEEGREILTYLPGETMGRDFPPTHPCLHSDATLAALGRFMRRLHDASAGFLPEALPALLEKPLPRRTLRHYLPWRRRYLEFRFPGRSACGAL